MSQALDHISPPTQTSMHNQLDHLCPAHWTISHPLDYLCPTPHPLDHLPPTGLSMPHPLDKICHTHWTIYVPPTEPSMAYPLHTEPSMPHPLDHLCPTHLTIYAPPTETYSLWNFCILWTLPNITSSLPFKVEGRKSDGIYTKWKGRMHRKYYLPLLKPSHTPFIITCNQTIHS